MKRNGARFNCPYFKSWASRSSSPLRPIRSPWSCEPARWYTFPPCTFDSTRRPARTSIRGWFCSNHNKYRRRREGRWGGRALPRARSPRSPPSWRGTPGLGSPRTEDFYNRGQTYHLSRSFVYLKRFGNELVVVGQVRPAVNTGVGAVARRRQVGAERLDGLGHQRRVQFRACPRRSEAHVCRFVRGRGILLLMRRHLCLCVCLGRWVSVNLFLLNFLKGFCFLERWNKI